MNLAQFKCIAVFATFATFAIIGFGPISITCLIGLYVVLMRPQWFWDLVCDVYAKVPLTQAVKQIIPHARIKCFLSLMGLFIIDIAPVPITSVIGMAIVLDRPIWFYRLAASIYDKS
ncbi:MAG: hypothetical protein ACXWT3_12960 [Methylococcaceae bacterium]